MSKAGISPDDYFEANDLVESLIIRQTYLQETKEFHISLAFAMTPELIAYLKTGKRPQITPPRDLRLLRFSGVSDVLVSDVSMKRKIDILSYSLTSSPPIELQEVKLQSRSRTQGKWYISLHYGTVGKCRFAFDSLKVEQRYGRGVKKGDDFVYYDAESGAEFDFYNPFPL